MTEPQKEFSFQLTKHLKENKFEEALKFFEGNVYNDIIKEYSWDIVPIVSSHLTTENVKCNVELIECCTAILNCIVEKCNPSETVLELLEQVEEPKDEVLFCIILNTLSKCLFKIDDKTRVIEWCTSTIRSYIESLPLPEKESEDRTAVLNKIINIYNAVISFLESLLENSKSNNSSKYEIIKDYLLSTLIFLMGKPLCYIQEKEFELQAKQFLPENIVILASRVTGDLLRFLNIVNVRSIKDKSKTKNINEERSNLKVILFESSVNISDLAYANFYFYIVTKSHLWEKVPQVYDLQYIFQSCIYLIIKLLERQETVSKGLKLMEELLRRAQRRSLTSNLLELSIYFDLFDVLVKVMVYSSDNKERKKALYLFQSYMEMFDMQARYFIVLHLYQTSEHSSLLSLTTGILKASIIECLQATPLIPYFLGSNLETLIKLACKLQHGSASDLVELSNEIISGLNLLRFLFIRDKRNETGIWNLIKELEKDYLKPLREGIDLCRAHWKVKLKDLEGQKKMYRAADSVQLEKSDTEITLTVGNKNLPALPVPEKILFCYQVLNGLDVMESILIRVNECFRSLWTCRALLTDQAENANAQQSSQKHSRESDEEYEKNIKSKILAASLNHVHELGWNQQAISAGAESIGYPGVIHGLFPNRGADLVHYFYLTCNQELNKILKEQSLAVQEDSAKKKKTLESQVRGAVETRLRMLIPYKKTWPQALALMALPPNVPMSLANLLTLVDDICYYAGDRSVDINWYTRRVVLAGIYKTTELYMLQDNSEDHEKSWSFLERRIKDATQIHSILTATSDMPLPDQALIRASEAANAAFVTARNILGLNWNR